MIKCEGTGRRVEADENGRGRCPACLSSRKLIHQRGSYAKLTVRRGDLGRIGFHKRVSSFGYTGTGIEWHGKS